MYTVTSVDTTAGAPPTKVMKTFFVLNIGIPNADYIYEASILDLYSNHQKKSYQTGVITGRMRQKSKCDLYDIKQATTYKTTLTSMLKTGYQILKAPFNHAPLQQFGENNFLHKL